MNFSAALDGRFHGQKRVSLGSIVEPLKHGATIATGTFVVMASGDRTIRAKILETEALHKGFSVPLPLNAASAKLKITPRYLLWFFAHDFVREHLLHHATGAVFLRVPRDVLYQLQIPVPKTAQKTPLQGEVVLTAKQSVFDGQLAAFYDDYVFNLRAKHYHTAIILAGAMAEMIIYQSLLDNEVDPKLLESDHNLGLGKMLTYLKLLKLEKDVPMNHLYELQKKRNAAVHAGLLAKGHHRFGEDDLKCFDQIIRHYGI